MLKAQQRLLREYLARQASADQDADYIQDKKRLKTALDENKPIPIHLRDNVKMREKLDLENPETLDPSRVRDDEYRLAGSYVPRVMITTSSSPTQPCTRFAKELNLLISGSLRMNRGQLSETEIAEMCRKDGITDLIEIGGADGEGRPTSMKVCHFPFGPTALYTISNVKLRSDYSKEGEKKPAHMKGVVPNLVFHDFSTKIGHRFKSNLRYLFPVTPEKSTRVLAFVNDHDHIVVRHYIWKTSSTLRKFHQNDPGVAGLAQERRNALMDKVEVEEIGPKFTLQPYQLIRATAEVPHPDIEWTRSAFIRKARPILGYGEVASQVASRPSAPNEAREEE